MPLELLNPPVAVWGAMIGVCFAIGVVNVGIWLRGLRGPRGLHGSNKGVGFLLVGITALALVCIGYFEIQLMTLQSPGDGTQLLRQAHGFVFVLFVAMALFVHVHLGTGRLWLLGAVLAVRLAIVIANFAGEGNIQHQAVTALRTVPFLGGQVTVVDQAVLNPWAVLVPLATLVFSAYVIDASARLWRKGDARQRRRAALVGGSVVLAVISSTTVSVLKQYSILDWPFMATPSFLFVVLAVGYELVAYVLRSADLSQQLRASRSESQLSEQRLRMATQAAGIGVWEWNRTRNEFHLSLRAQDILGLAASQPMGSDRFFDRIQTEDRTALRAAMENASHTVEMDVLARVKDRSGRQRWIALRGRTLGDSSTQEPLLCGVLADVTERQEHDESLSVVANASPIGVAMVNRSGVIVFANRKMEDLFGYAPGELLGVSVDALVPPTLRDRHAVHRYGHFTAGMSRAMQGGRDVTGLRKDGREITVEIGLVQEKLGGEPVTLANVIDQGWRRDAEHELAKQRDELALLSRAALLGELSGSLAHELNQPLTSILINAQATQQLVTQGRLDPATLNDILVDIVSDTRRAGNVIHRLRLLLRHGQSTMERVDLEAVAQEVLHLLNSDLMERRVTVHTAFEPGLPQVIGDRVQLQQVVLNLLMNACEAMAGGSGTRRVWVGGEMDAEGRVRFSVVDEGPGIPQDKLAQIFEAFVTTKAEGLGLGLSLCRRIIEHHGGAIAASNNAAGGATFEFALPPAPEQGL